MPWDNEADRRLAEQGRPIVEASIDDLIRLTAQYNPLELLARLTVFQIFGAEGRKMSEQGNGTRSESQVEYCQSLILSHPFPEDAAEPDPDTCQALIDQAQQLFIQATVFYGASTAASAASEDEADLRRQTMIEALHIRGAGYETHIKQTFHDIAGQHDEFLRAKCGFSSGEFWQAIETAERSLNDRVNRTAAYAFGLWDNLIDEFRARTHVLNGEHLTINEAWEIPEFREFALRNSERINEWKTAFDQIGNASAFRLTPDAPVTTAIYERLALQFGENANFLDGIPAWRAWPLNPSKIQTRPLIKHDGHFYLFIIPLLFRGALTCLEAIIATEDTDYWKQRFLPSRDAYVETKSIEQFEKLLPGCRVIRNYFYDHGEDGIKKRSEGDGLIIYDDTLIILEDKAGKISDQARRGALKSLRADLEELVDKAYQQAARTLNFIRESDEVKLLKKNGEELCRLRYRNFRNVFLVAVSFDALASLSTGLPLLRRLGMVQGKEWPWSVSLYDLRVIAEVSDHPTTFLHYLTRRIRCNAHEKLVSSDEIDLFGHYLKQGLYFDESEDFINAGTVLVHDWSSDIDDYFQHIMGLGPEVQKPRVPMHPLFERLITTLEAARPRHFVSACLALQDFDDPSRKKAAAAVGEIDSAYLEKRVLFACLAPGRDRIAVIFGAGRVNSPQENQILERCRSLLEKHEIDKAIAIVWEPPLSNKRIRTFIV